MSEQTAPTTRPGLTPTPRTTPWWDAAANGELLIQRCESCGHAQHYPRILCTACWSEALVWEVASGKGIVRTFTVVHMPGHPAWKSATPYVLALVELDEGPVLMTNVVDCPADSVVVGMPVQCEFVTEPGDAQPLPRFRPAAA